MIDLHDNEKMNLECESKEEIYAGGRDGGKSKKRIVCVE